MQDVFGMEHSDPEQQLREPVTDYFLVQPLVVFLELLDVSR